MLDVEATFSATAARDLRAQLGLSQKRMAELAGYKAERARQNWCDIEAGRRGMDEARWELLLLRAEMHPKLKLVDR